MSTMYAVPVRPGFDYLTMLSDWRDYLQREGLMGREECMARLIAALTERQAVLFRMDVLLMGLRWDELNGEFSLRPEYAKAVEKGFTSAPTREMVDESWLSTFEEIEDDIHVLIEELSQDGGLF